MTSGTQFTVMGIQKEKLILSETSDLEKLKDQGGRESTLKTIKININTAEEKHFEYAYASTPYKTNLPKCDTIIAYQGANTRQSHQKLFIRY